jgi:hypothetical protein
LTLTGWLSIVTICVLCAVPPGPRLGVGVRHVAVGVGPEHPVVDDPDPGTVAALAFEGVNPLDRLLALVPLQPVERVLDVVGVD